MSLIFNSFDKSLSKPLNRSINQERAHQRQNHHTKALVLLPLVSALVLSVTGCQSTSVNANVNANARTNNQANVHQDTLPSIELQKNPNNRPDTRPNKPFSEIPLITESNRPADKPDAYIPPFGQAGTSSKVVASWRKPAIAKSATDAVYAQEWAKSETKAACPILALPKNASSHLAGHSARRANFSGGWGVAYDVPKQRSAYGVALSGISDPIGQASIWQDYQQYNDGTELTYGREGGDPNGQWLAYLTLGKQYSPTSQHCFYNIWSQQSKGHLEQMLSELRLVKP